MKYVILVPDGMSDLPLEELNGRTCLEAANCPNMDMLARNKRGYIVAVRRASIPLWVVIVSSAGLGLGLTAVPLLIRSLRAWRRRAVGHCPTCGYDLTGNVSGRCPECGTPRRDSSCGHAASDAF